MRKLARFTATLAIGALALGLSGCGNDKNATPTKGDSSKVTMVTNGMLDARQRIFSQS